MFLFLLIKFQNNEFHFRQNVLKKIEMVFHFCGTKKQPEHSLKLAIKIKPRQNGRYSKNRQFLSENTSSTPTKHAKR